MAMRAVVTALLFGLCTGVSAAHAQSRDPAAAELLFAAGREAFDKGDYATACPKFEESQRLDPAAGTLINLARCHEKVGKLASAWEAWRQALQLLDGADERRPSVERHTSDIEARVPRLEIKIAGGAPPGTRVTRDDVELGAASLGMKLPVDPGLHVVVARAPERYDRQYEVKVEEGRVTSLVVEPGEARPPDVAPPGSAAARPVVPAPVRDTPQTATGGGKRTLGFVLGGVGIAGIVTGSVTGILAIQKKNSMLDDCEKVGDGYTCGSSGVDAANAGKTLAGVSTFGFAIGVAGLALGGWFVFADGGSGTTALVPRVTPAGATLGAVRTF
jgi:hypothetical protein